MAERKAWLLNSKPHGIDRMDEFKKQSIVAVGWPRIGDLSGKTKADIKALLSGKPYEYEGHRLGRNYATLNLFVNEMKKGDIVMTPNGKYIYFAEIKGDYKFDPKRDTDDEGYPHQREVEWIKERLKTDMSDEFRQYLKAPTSITNITAHTAEIERLINGAPSVRAESIKLSYPLRNDFFINFSIPKDMTEDEAQRFGQYVRTLYFS